LLKVRTLAFLFALTSTILAVDHQVSIAPETVVVPSGKLRLKAFLWKPSGPRPFPAVLFCHGSGGADAGHTAGLPMTEAAEKLAPVFLKHGYAFLYLFRRGQGPSANQGEFMQNILQREEAAKGKEGLQHLQFMLATTDHLDDVIAGLSFLKTAPLIDARRIAIVGHSFGGQLTLLAAQQPNTVRAAVAFAAAANSWERSRELRDRLLTAADKATAPIMLIQTANDTARHRATHWLVNWNVCISLTYSKFIRPSVERQKMDTISFTLRSLSGRAICSGFSTNTLNLD
jgi:dienelactone hydrolase